ncbi:MAG: hypothetical protein NVS3B25_24740 [Hymenobacter sp.]
MVRPVVVAPVVVAPDVLPDVLPLVVPAFSAVVHELMTATDAHSSTPVSPESRLRFIRKWE